MYGSLERQVQRSLLIFSIDVIGKSVGQAVVWRVRAVLVKPEERTGAVPIRLRRPDHCSGQGVEAMRKSLAAEDFASDL
ncbi:UNVERIFIED_CONTAM: hypothetical protein K2H54_044315 [Gekko kuhli]